MSPSDLSEIGHALGYMISTGDRHWHIRVVSLLLVIGPLLFKLGAISLHSEILAPSAVESLINIAFYINLFTLVLSVISTHYFHGEMKGMETDGLQIINAIKNQRSK